MCPILADGHRGCEQGERELENSGVQGQWSSLHSFCLVVQGWRDFLWVKCTLRKEVHRSHLCSVPPEGSSPGGPQLHVTVGCLLGSEVEGIVKRLKPGGSPTSVTCVPRIYKSPRACPRRCSIWALSLRGQGWPVSVTQKAMTSVERELQSCQPYKEMFTTYPPLYPPTPLKQYLEERGIGRG